MRHQSTVQKWLLNLSTICLCGLNFWHATSANDQPLQFICTTLHIITLWRNFWQLVFQWQMRRLRIGKWLSSLGLWCSLLGRREPQSSRIQWPFHTGQSCSRLCCRQCLADGKWSKGGLGDWQDPWVGCRRCWGKTFGDSREAQWSVEDPSSPTSTKYR